jgi:hypothetical protein
MSLSKTNCPASSLERLIISTTIVFKKIELINYGKKLIEAIYDIL